MKKAGTSGQESTVFILLEENEQVEPIDTLPLYQEVVKRKNQQARGHSTLFLNPFPVTHPIHDDRERMKEPVAAGKAKGMKGRFGL